MANKIRLKHFVFSVSLVLVSTSFSTPLSHRASNNKCISNERHALLHFKSYIDHDPYGHLSTWKLEKEEEATTYCCNWGGVTCNNQTGHVTSLDLRVGFLGGKISPLLFNLSYLNHPDLSINSFHGNIPMFIGSMTQLRYFDISFNFLSGTVPMFIGSGTQLRYYDIYSNSFGGTIPMFNGSMTQLRYLDLGSNDFSGTIPSEFGNLTKLQELSLYFLGSCTIDSLEWLSHLSQLKNLDMSHTSLGKVNNWVNAIICLQNLSLLSLDDCDLSRVKHPYSYTSVNSSFPSSIITLSLLENNLNSSLYQWLFPLTGNRLVYLELSGNQLGGIPTYFGNLCSLKYLFLDGNKMPAKFPDILNNLSGCTSFVLKELDASDSQFTGSFSDDIQKFSSLESLDLSNNQLNGTISEKVWQLPRLQRLDASSNILKGALSKYIEKSKLLVIDLSNNSLQGVPLEAHMSNLSDVEYIDLSSCKLGPHFPKWIQTMRNLSSINLANTRISDTIPEEFWNKWPSRLISLNLSVNNITGIVTYMLSNFSPRSSYIDLSSNNFYGRILNLPPSLRTLDLSRNKFSGEIFFFVPNC